MAISLESGKRTTFLTPQQRKQRQLLGLLFVVLIAIAMVLYFGYFKKNLPANSIDSINSMDNSAEFQQSNAGLMEEIKKVDPNNLIFKNKRFIDLVVHGDLPLTVGQKGRENPFAPF